jgi:L-ascorbate metabolism protein UlaG (beta-lactamase superfamily)
MPWLGEGKKSAFARPSMWALFRWLFSRNPPPFPHPKDFEVVKPSFDTPPMGKAKISWIGHSTCLLQVGGLNILTDAVFSERCSPFQWSGPKRYVPPACTINELPKIDLVVTSHDHYDHLDWYTADELETLHKPIFACGLELGSWFRENLKVKNDRIIELDWWEEKVLFNGQLKIRFLPVQHWSKRKAIGDERRTLWGGFSIEFEGFKFFFNGDTGYSEELYQEIFSKCGYFDVSAIPIGAYEPRNIMKTQHIDPEEAFLIHQHLKSQCSFGIHHATFILTDEPIREPAQRVKKLSESNPDVPPFLAIKHGASIIYDISSRSFELNE